MFLDQYGIHIHDFEILFNYFLLFLVHIFTNFDKRRHARNFKTKKDCSHFKLLNFQIYLKGYALCRRPLFTPAQKVGLAFCVCTIEFLYL